LVLICWRSLLRRSARWLINWNALVGAVVLTVSSFVDLGAIAGSWKVRRQAMAAIDLCYLGQVGEGALLPLIALEQQKIDAVTPDRVRYAVAIGVGILADRARHSNVLLVRAANTSSLNRKLVLMRYARK